VVVLGRRSIIDLPTILIAAATLLALVKLGRCAPEPLLVAAAGLLVLPSATDRHPTPQPAAPPDLTTHSVGADVSATWSIECRSPSLAYWQPVAGPARY